MFLTSSSFLGSSLVQVVEELLVALNGLLVLLDLLGMELGLMDLVVLQAVQLFLLLQDKEITLLNDKIKKKNNN